MPVLTKRCQIVLIDLCFRLIERKIVVGQVKTLKLKAQSQTKRCLEKAANNGDLERESNMTQKVSLWTIIRTISLQNSITS